MRWRVFWAERVFWSVRIRRKILFRSFHAIFFSILALLFFSSKKGGGGECMCLVSVIPTFIAEPLRGEHLFPIVFPLPNDEMGFCHLA